MQQSCNCPKLRQWSARLSLDFWELETGFFWVSILRPSTRLDFSESQYRDRIWDWKYLSLNLETKSETIELVETKTESLTISGWWVLDFMKLSWGYSWSWSWAWQQIGSDPKTTWPCPYLTVECVHNLLCILVAYCLIISISWNYKVNTNSQNLIIRASRNSTWDALQAFITFILLFEFEFLLSNKYGTRTGVAELMLEDGHVGMFVNIFWLTPPRYALPNVCQIDQAQ